MVPRERLGLQRSGKFRFEFPPVDDSSTEGGSSGEESRGENPGPRRPNNPGGTETRTRRQIIQDDTAAFNRKTDRHSARWGAMEDSTQRRQAHYEIYLDYQERGIIFPRIFTLLWDLEHKDFLLLEFCEFGDLQNLLYR
jgi:hypothetical protein